MVKTYAKNTSLSCELHEANMFRPSSGVVLVILLRYLHSTIYTNT